MEFLRDGNLDKAEYPRETSKETKRNRKWLNWFEIIGKLKDNDLYIREVH